MSAHLRVISILFLAVLFAPPLFAQTSPDGKLRVVWWDNTPHSFEDNGDVTGFGIELLREVLESMGLKESDIELKKIERFSDAYELVVNGKADMGAMPILQTSDREEDGDFSYSAIHSGHQILVASSQVKTISLRQLFEQVQVLKIIGVAFIIVLLVAHLVWFVERNKPESDFDHTYVRGIFDAFWWATVTVTTVGYGDRTPRRAIGKVFAILWMSLGLFLVSLFVAKVTAVMTLGAIESSVKGIEDIRDLTVGTVEGSTFADYLRHERIDFIGYPVNTDLYEAFKKGEINAIFYDANSLAYFSKHRTDAHLVGPIYRRSEQAYFFTNSHPLRDDFNRALLEIKENGTWSEIHDKYFPPHE